MNKNKSNAEIRKLKREEILSRANRRPSNTIPNTESQINANIQDHQQLKHYINKWQKNVFQLKEFPSLVQKIFSIDRFQQHYGLIGITGLLLCDDPPITEVIEAGIVPKLISFTKTANEPYLQIEAAIALSNLVRGDTQETASIIDEGIVPCVISLLKHFQSDIVESAITTVGNIACDSSNARDALLINGVLAPLIGVVSASDDPHIIRNGIWAISSLCRGNPPPELKLVEPALPILCKIIKEELDPSIIMEAAWGLVYLLETDENKEAIVDLQLIPVLMRYLEKSYLSLLVPCLRIIGSVMSQILNHKELLLGIPNLVPVLFKLTQHKKQDVAKEAFCVLSSVLCDTEQINIVIENKEYLNMLIKIAGSDYVMIRNGALALLSIAIQNMNSIQFIQAIEIGLLDCLRARMDDSSSGNIQLALEGIENVLNKKIESMCQKNIKNQCLVEFKGKGILHKIAELESHSSPEISAKALEVGKLIALFNS